MNSLLNYYLNLILKILFPHILILKKKIYLLLKTKQFLSYNLSLKINLSVNIILDMVLLIKLVKLLNINLLLKMVFKLSNGKKINT